MLAIATASIILGFILLMWSADHLVEHASILAKKLGVSTFLVGIIVIGFGTSAPELFVSALAAWENNGNLAIGNAIGSNITNIGMVLGSAALFSAFKISRQTAYQDIPLVLLAGVISIIIIYDGLLSRLDGIILFSLLASFLIWSALKPNAEPAEELPEIPADTNITKELAWSAFCIALLIAASKILVFGAVEIATALGVSQLIIGLTVIAIGTSLPELAASISAAKKGVHNMIVGNIIGSNIFNTLGVLGMTGMVRATSVDTAALSRDFPVMFGFTTLLLLFAVIQKKLSRFSGLALVSSYIIYLGYLVMQANS